MKYNFSCPNIDVQDFVPIQEIIKSGWVSIGKHMEELERQFRVRTGVKHAIACSSATSGLTIAIKAAGWQNKRIGVPAFTWPSTVYAIECSAGNTPVFCDIDRDSWLVRIDKPCDAAISVDTFGNQSYISRQDIPVIYDAAHGYDLPDLGKRGLAEVVSFSFTKLVTAMEGGIILTDNDELADVARELRRLAGRMCEINAYVALSSMGYYYSHAGKQNSDIINKYIDGLKCAFRKQYIPIRSNYSVFAILFEDQAIRNAVANALREFGLEVKIYYDPIVDGLPNTDYVYSHILSLPARSNIVPIQDKIIEIINTTVMQTSMTPGKRYMRKSGYVS